MKELLQSWKANMCVAPN